MRLIGRYLTAVLLAGALAALSLGVGARPALAQGGGVLPATCAELSGTRTCTLWAKSGTIGLPGFPALPVWSYTDSASGLPGAVGPTLVANQGETLVVNLTNSLGEATSLSIPGLSGAEGAPVAAGGQGSYTFSNLPAGTYLYQAGVRGGASGPRQIAMGMVGALVVHSATPGSAYGTPASAFTDEAVLLYSEIDPALNASPASFVLQHFKPTFLLINGKAYPNTSAISSTAGSSVLLRQINAGIRFHSTGALGLRQTIIADDGVPLPAPSTVVARTIGAGQTVDSLVRLPATTAAVTTYPFYETGMPGNGPAGANGMGGMLTFIAAAGVGAPTPTPSPSPTALPADTTPPSVGGVGFASLSNATTTLPLTSSASDNLAVSGATYQVDSLPPVAFVFSPGASVSLSASVNVSALSSGAHSITVRAVDAAGNAAARSASFTIDRVAPTVSGATLSPTTVLAGAAVALNATVSDATSGIRSASYVVDGGSAVALTVGANGAVQTAISTTGLTAGSHSVVVTAVDNATNSFSTTALSFSIDDTLFANGFEGSTAQPYGWSSVGGTASRLALATSGQIAGARSLRATVSNSSSGYVQQNLSAAQTTAHARFYLNPSALTYTSNANATTARVIFRAVNGASEAFRLELHRTAATSGNFEVRAVVSRQNGTTTTSWYPLNAGANYVELAWAQGASSQFQLYTNGTLRQTLSTLATSAYGVGSVQLGPQGTLTGVGGSLLLDSMKVTRTALIGTSN